jgi:hypothetical protein
MVLPPASSEYAIRLGDEHTRKRLELEALARSGQKPRRNWRDSLAHRLEIYTLLRWVLKGCGIYARGHRNYLNLRVVESPVRLTRLPEALDGFRILQLTDLHLDLEPALVRAIRKRLSGVGYDLTVFTGDFKNLTATPSEPAMALLKELLPSLQPPFFATLGNHDTLDLVPSLEAMGIRTLLNEHTVIEHEGASLVLAGVDDSYSFQTDDIARALEGTDPEACKILLSHAPDNYRAAEAAGVDYFIAGHTHGGQICNRKGKPFYIPGNVPPELIAGRWKHGSMYGYTSRGTGACHVPVRFNCPPEITVHILRRAES